MGRLTNYEAQLSAIGPVRAAGDFPVLEAYDIQTGENGERLSDELERITALEEQLAELTYKAPVISKFEATPNKIETGNSADVGLSWSITKGTNDYTTTLNGTTVTGNSTTKTGVSSNTNYTLKAKDTKTNKEVSKTISVSFEYRKYYGVNEKASLTDAEIKGLSSDLSGKSSFTKTFTCNNKYIYCVIPTTFGTPTFKTALGEGGFSKIGSTTTLKTGTAAVTYDIYRSNQAPASSADITILF